MKRLYRKLGITRKEFIKEVLLVTFYAVLSALLAYGLI